MPEQSPKTTSAINDLLLQNILTTLAKEQVKYVGLVATDPRDKILLASLIRKHCPDVQLYTTNGDYILAHPDFVSTMQGIVVGSSYPFSVGPQTVTGSDDQRLLFGYQAFQGIYNAVIAHLAQPEVYRADGAKLIRHMRGYESCTDAKHIKTPYFRPTVWISVIGQNNSIISVYKVPSDQMKDDLDKEHLFDKFVEKDEEILRESFVGTIALIGSPFGQSRLLASSAKYTGQTGTNMNFGSPAPDSLQFSTFWLCSLVLLTATVWWLFHKRLGVSFSNNDQPRDIVWPRLGPGVNRICLGFACAVIGVLSVWLFSLALLPLNAVHWDKISREPHWSFVVNTLVSFCAIVLLSLSVGHFVYRLIFAIDPKLFDAPVVARRSIKVRRIDATFAVAIVLIVLLLTYLLAPGRDGVTNQAMYFERLVHLPTGLSPVIPALLLGVNLVAWCYFIRKEYSLLDSSSVQNPFAELQGEIKPFSDIAKYSKEIQAALQTFSIKKYRRRHGDNQSPASSPQLLKFAFNNWTILGIVILLITIASCHICSRWVRTIDGSLFDWLIYCGLVVAALLIGFTLCHAIFVWGGMKDLLREVAKLPLAKAFRRLPPKVKHLFDRAFYANKPGDTSLSFLGHQMRWLYEHMPAAQNSGLNKGANSNVGSGMIVGLQNSLAEAVNLEWNVNETGDLSKAAEDRRKKEVTLVAVFIGCIKILQPYWEALSLEEAYSTPLAEGESTGAQGRAGSNTGVTPPTVISGEISGTAVTARFDVLPKDTAPEWIAKAEDFVAMVIVRYLSQFFVHLRNLLRAVTLSVILLLLTVTLYPFHPQNLLLVYVGVLLAAVVGTVIFIFVMINQDEVMSHLAGNTPNRFTPDSAFIREIGQYVLPAVGILVIQFSAVSSVVRWLLDPLLRAIH